MEKRKLGEQWVEEIDGKKHIVKAVKGLCENCGVSHLCNLSSDCPMAWGLVGKDLGILNEDGCLPSDFGVYPEVYEHTLMGIDGYMVKAYTSEPHIGKYAWGKTKQQAIDAWNRR